MTPGGDEQLAALVDDLARRVAALERRDPPSGAAPPATAGDQPPAAGFVSYGGEVDLAGPVSWSITYGADDVVGLDRDRTAAVLSALAHPSRLAIVSQLLRGTATSAALQESLGEVSSGQLYHHLNALAAAGVIAKGGRNHYRIAAPAVVPVLVVMLASADLGGQLPTGPGHDTRG